MRGRVQDDLEEEEEEDDPNKFPHLTALLAMQYAQAAHGSGLSYGPKGWMKFISNLEYKNSRAEHITGDTRFGSNAAGRMKLGS